MGIFKAYAESYYAQKAYDFDQSDYEKRINNLGFFDSPEGRCAALTALWLSRYQRKQLGGPRTVKHSAYSFKALTGFNQPVAKDLLDARTECADMVNKLQNLNDTKKKELRRVADRLGSTAQESPQYPIIQAQGVKLMKSGAANAAFLKIAISDLCPGIGTDQLKLNDETKLLASERDKLADQICDVNGRYYIVSLEHAHGAIIDNAFQPQGDNDGVFKFFDSNWGSATFNNHQKFKTFLSNYFRNRAFWNNPFAYDEKELAISYMKSEF